MPHNDPNMRELTENIMLVASSSSRNCSGRCLRILYVHIMCNCLLPFSERFFTSTKWFNKTQRLAATPTKHTHAYTHTLTNERKTHDKSVARASSQHIHINNSDFDEWWSAHNEGMWWMCITCTRAWHGQSAPTISKSRNNNTTQYTTKR